MKFLDGLDQDLKSVVLRQLRDLWTYTSTGLEGNSLSLGDTQFVIEEGLTVSGKSIKDHQEVLGHAKAIEIIYSMLDRLITTDDIFGLHKAIQSEVVSDIYKPYGAWKLEPNGTYAVNDAGKHVFIEYAAPVDVPDLMLQWLKWFNACCERARVGGLDLNAAVDVYTKAHVAFVHVHPFWDGNGRLARLLANLPVLAAGLPPIVIARESRQVYLRNLAKYQLEAGQLSKATGLWPLPDGFSSLIELIKDEYQTTQTIIDDAFGLQRKRRDSART